MEANYYKEYFVLEREHWYFLARNKLILDHIRSITEKNKVIKILNVGAGTGYTSELLQEIGDVNSIEYDEDCCEYVNQNLNIEVTHGSILELPYSDNEFDLVCAFDVIEHIEDDKQGVLELKRVCKKDGKVVITVPAYKFLWSKHDQVNHHFRRYTKTQLTKLLHGDGKILYESYYNFWLFFPISVFRIFNRIFKLTTESKDDTGSDFSVISKESVLSRFLFKIFYSESFFIKNRIKLPFGISIIVSWIK